MCPLSLFNTQQFAQDSDRTRVVKFANLIELKLGKTPAKMTQRWLSCSSASRTSPMPAKNSTKSTAGIASAGANGRGSAETVAVRERAIRETPPRIIPMETGMRIGRYGEQTRIRSTGSESESGDGFRSAGLPLGDGRVVRLDFGDG